MSPDRLHRKRYNFTGPVLLKTILLVVLPALLVKVSFAQSAPQPSVAQQVHQLTESMTRAQDQIEESQRQLNEMRKQLATLMQRVESGDAVSPVPSSTATGKASSSSATENSASGLESAVQAVQDTQAMQSSQICTLDQLKVESQSKYPVKINGLLLFNGFINTSAVDVASTPTMAQAGAGSTGATTRQTILGIEAHGPHLFGASSEADLNVDFDGTPQGANPGGSTGSYAPLTSSNSTLLRLRTAHASLEWPNTTVFFSLDRPIFSPDTPTSLATLANPALAWSGNLWSWNPQAGVTQYLPLSKGKSLQLQAALVDVGDAPGTTWLAYTPTTATAPPTTAEQSRWPGGEVHFSLLGSKRDEGAHFGLGGYLAPHVSLNGVKFNSWANTLDYRLPLPLHFELTGSAYRGEALGGLGAGAYKDYIIRQDSDGTGTNGTGYYFRSLNDIGGWAQLKQSWSDRLQFNTSFGIDEVFAHQLRRYAGPPSSTYLNLARNRTYVGNVIYSPSAYLLFSFEYRYLQSAPVIGTIWGANVFGLAAAYKF